VLSCFYYINRIFENALYNKDIIKFIFRYVGLTYQKNVGDSTEAGLVAAGSHSQAKIVLSPAS
jgi:hypothetical protein